MRLVITDSAQADLLDAWIYVAEDNQRAADRLLETIEREAQLLLQQPFMGRARPELGTSVRSWPSATPYILFYTAGTEELTVLRVLHHARDISFPAF